MSYLLVELFARPLALCFSFNCTENTNSPSVSQTGSADACPQRSYIPFFDTKLNSRQQRYCGVCYKLQLVNERRRKWAWLNEGKGELVWSCEHCCCLWDRWSWGFGYWSRPWIVVHSTRLDSLLLSIWRYWKSLVLNQTNQFLDSVPISCLFLFKQTVVYWCSLNQSAFLIPVFSQYTIQYLVGIVLPLLISLGNLSYDDSGNAAAVCLELFA